MVRVVARRASVLVTDRNRSDALGLRRRLGQGSWQAAEKRPGQERGDPPRPRNAHLLAERG
jgi:hypothetical protein